MNFVVERGAGKPEDSRYTSRTFKSSPSRMLEGLDQKVEIVEKLKPIISELGCSLTQISIAWAVSNERVSMVLLGASHPVQLEETLQTIAFENKITPKVKTKVDQVGKFVPSLLKLDLFALVLNRFL
ncbi:hypothetical protein BBO99_00009853 [Phytophthora kernoviae]|uniref:NADP-dependent oxidoreductase domain-containing protein n=1 Tax=Phytophthora kernoviae TaxID=325452 RepID=A0A3R7FZR6_9STRA|nr:hypothetical protein BBI17_009907 [Phytophthora kernoviae]RLN72285.1 hypothetical protein BBO99_00009853 [Phytophthora kernoviae]